MKNEMIDIQKNLYKSAIFVALFISMYSIIGNLIVKFPFSINLKWFLLILISLLAYWSLKRNYHVELIKNILFLILIIIVFPLSFMDSGGSKSNTIAYIGLLQLIIIFLFSRWKRLVLFVLTVLLFITLHIIEYYYPSFIKIYSPEIIFFDRLIQLPIIFCLSFAILLAFVKEYNRTNNKYYQLANYDELTGLYNRRKFDFVVHNTLNENVEHTCLVLFDLDNFKRVNDNLGHRKGDEVLKEFSSILTKNVDFNEHIICRWGGDEFAIIYYGDKEELEIIINSIKKQFHSYAYKVNDDLKVSGSIVVLEEYDSYEEALNAVDGLLYSEKYIKKSITKE